MSADTPVIIERSGTEDEGTSVSILGNRISESSWLSNGYRTVASYDVTREDFDNGTPLRPEATIRIVTVRNYYFESRQDGKCVDTTSLIAHQNFPVPIAALKHLFPDDLLQN